VVTFEDAGAAAGLRKPSDRSGTLRVVTIAEIDRSACGGTHVRGTAEIGAILVRKVERVKKRVRVDFVCGLRATRRARADYLALGQVASGFSAALDDVPALAEKQRADLREAHAARDLLLGRIAVFEARDRVAAATLGASGRRVVWERAAGGLDGLRPLALAVAALDGAVFVGSSEHPPSILIATSASSGIDAGATLKQVLVSTGGRGGGSPRLAQGSLPSGEALATALATLDGTLT
jgi:alanyl-tRNA synthetase